MTASRTRKKGQPAPVAVESGPGFRGSQADETPNENYTVSGVVAGKPTPETAGG